MFDGRPVQSNSLTRRQLLRAAALLPAAARAQSRESRLMGYWPLRGDARDHSGQENHAANHGVNLATGQFDGRSSYLEVPARPALDPRAGDFSISSWVYTKGPVLDMLGDVVSKFDSASLIISPARSGRSGCIIGRSVRARSPGSPRAAVIFDNVDECQKCNRSAV